jgi:dTDP-4-dehydrorhamnose 3,5-epimerase
MPFDFMPLAIPEVLLIAARVQTDPRGSFRETYKRSEFAAAGISDSFVQENHSSSQRGVLRGLHFQRAPQAQSKLVRVVSGAIFDVAVDLRPNSATRGRWVGVNLAAADGKMTYIPGWCAHGFCVLSERAEVVYLASAEYSPAHESGIMWNDPELAIEWPLSDPIVSDRDKQWPRLTEVR